jgi:hypothetical protein
VHKNNEREEIMEPPISTANLKMCALINVISGELRGLHKALIQSEAEDFGLPGNPFQLLNLVVNHPHFAWLHALSELMAEMDASLDSDEIIDSNTAAAFKAMIETLIGPRVPSNALFRERYLLLLQHSPAVVVAHSELRRALDKIPDRSSDEPHK